MQEDRLDYTGMFRLDGRDAVVVGSGSGIGREVARALAAHGAAVTCADINENAATETAAMIGAAARPFALDVRDSASVVAAANELEDAEILVLTAGGNVRKRLLDYSLDEFDAIVHLNLRGSFDLVRAFGANMVQRGRGSIIGFSSIRSVTTEPGQAVYSATKAGLVQLMRTAAAEFGPAGVRVNVVAPGAVDTPLTATIRSNTAWSDAYARRSALGRWAHPSEMTGAVIYLASNAASFVTGSVIFVDGGWTAIDGRFDPPA
jgi:NAD(P)-dependent dehydrogenase (short-subunit alcohol dehydrogenase family)